MNGSGQEGEVTATIHGERFAVEVEDGTVFLVHPKWSLVGSGRDYSEARRDLETEAAMILREFEDVPESQASEQIKAMVRYARKLVGPTQQERERE